MKKQLTMLAAAAVIACGSAFAGTNVPANLASAMSAADNSWLLQVASSSKSLGLTPSRHISDLIKEDSTAIAPKADGGIVDPNAGFTIQFCEDVNTWYCLYPQNKLTYRCFIYITPDMATQVAGNRITDISFSATPDVLSPNGLEGSVFVAEEGPNSENYMTVVTETPCHVISSYASSMSGGPEFQTIALDEPYTIKADTGFFIGYTVENCKYSTRTGQADYPVGLDGYEANPFCGFVELSVTSSGKRIGIVDLGEYLGTNLFLAAKTEGEHDGFKDLFWIGSLQFGDFYFPVVEPEELSFIYLPVINLGNNALTSISYATTINGVESAPTELAINIRPKEADNVKIELKGIVEGRNNIDLVVDHINSAEVEGKASVQAIALDPANAFPRNFLVEEFTGQWCGYCPRGIVGMDYMSENYPDFVGVAVHWGDEDSKDDLCVEDYVPVVDTYTTSFPSCIVNRDPFYVFDPSKNNLESVYKYWQTQLGAAKIDLTVTRTDDGGLEANAATTFAFSQEDADYNLIYVVIENGLKGIQHNYFNTSNPLEGWDDKGEWVVWRYNDTARSITDAFGIEGSIPTSFTKGVAVSNTTALPTDDIEDIENTAVIAMLMDGQSYTILNATRVEAKDYKTSGVGSIIDDATDAPVTYYNLQGVRIPEPTSAGLYLRRQGSTTTKTVIR